VLCTILAIFVMQERKLYDPKLETLIAVLMMCRNSCVKLLNFTGKCLNYVDFQILFRCHVEWYMPLLSVSKLCKCRCDKAEILLPVYSAAVVIDHITGLAHLPVCLFHVQEKFPLGELRYSEIKQGPK